MLSASSPDEEALVLGAKYFGVEFAERIDTKAVVHRTEVCPLPTTFLSVLQCLVLPGWDTVVVHAVRLTNV